MLSLQLLEAQALAALAAYPDGERKAIARLALESFLPVTQTDVLLDKSIALSPEQMERWLDIVQRLKSGEPVQYILGRVEFAGLSLEFNHHTLIPRPETEGLIDWAWETACGQLTRILDAGTGSGCIALALQKRLPLATVTAWDISPDTLEVAMRNATSNGCHVEFQLRDMLCEAQKAPDPRTPFDLIVSNPPYIPERERETLEPHVLQHEPHAALFVPDYDPLVFYRALALLGQHLLTPDGSVIVETHRDYTRNVAELFELLQYRHIEVREDCFGVPRMVKAVK